MMKKFLTVLVLGLAVFAVSCSKDDDILSISVKSTVTAEVSFYLETSSAAKTVMPSVDNSAKTITFTGKGDTGTSSANNDAISVSDIITALTPVSASSPVFATILTQLKTVFNFTPDTDLTVTAYTTPTTSANGSITFKVGDDTVTYAIKVVAGAAFGA